MSTTQREVQTQYAIQALAHTTDRIAKTLERQTKLLELKVLRSIASGDIERRLRIAQRLENELWPQSTGEGGDG